MRLSLGCLTLVVLVSSIASAEEKLSREHVEFFEKKVRPVLVQHCYQCHSKDAKSLKGGLLLDTKQGWQAGGDTGDAIVPGDVEESLLISSIKHESYKMPPKGKLSDAQIRDLEQWVKMGAPDPRDDSSSSLIKRDINIEEGRQFWAFQPPQAAEPPKVKNQDWPVSDLDRFVLAELEKKNIAPVEDAEPRVLVRRIYFDLVGLPPTPEQVDSFVKAAKKNQQAALEELVDELLESPRFGERWGRHWLDVARFAESTGMERNVTFTQAWRYRDWVIDAFNKDKPFDQFLTEQIAGDLLTADKPDQHSVAEHNVAEHNANIIATGFLAMGPKSLNERNKALFQMDIVDEQIDVTTRAFMGVTVSCARCHDHKFDPFPTEDYYAIAGIFRSSNTNYGTGGGNGNRQPGKLIPLKTTSGEEQKVDPKVAAAEKAEREKRTKLNNLNKELVQARRRTQVLTKEVKVKATTAEEKKELAAKRKEIAELRKRQGQLNKEIKKLNGGKNNNQRVPTGPAAMGVTEGAVADCRVHIRGNVQNLGESVPRGFLQVVNVNDTPKLSGEQSGRLELAAWMTRKDNPLTSRVIANRTWHWLFGQGIVRTVDNFGQMGERPSNQALLDHLAGRMVAHGWSTKALIREIVTSRTYRLASTHDPASFQVDPENRLHWRQNHKRLDAESIRDAMLAVGGGLKLDSPGPSIVSKSASTNVGRNQQILGAINGTQFKHRSVYLPILRNNLPELLKVFDFAEPSILVGRRQLTTVPSQALYMMNSRFVQEQSQALADRLIAEPDMDDAAKLNHAFQLIFARTATAAELAKTQELLQAIQSNLREDMKPNEARRDALASVCQALLASAEFRYVE